MDAVRSNIQSVAKAFRLAARAETKADLDAAGYGERLGQLSGPSRMATDLRGLQFEALRVQQKRYFAYCLAQLSEAGMELEELFMTMKGDTLDQGSSYAVRACLEEGPEAVLASELFTEAERAHWKAVFAGEPGAWERMQKHLIETYQLPFRAPPPPAESP
jgi:hypothetical protein